jgi:hypothetical protein
MCAPETREVRIVRHVSKEQHIAKARDEIVRIICQEQITREDFHDLFRAVKERLLFMDADMQGGYVIVRIKEA